ncbi:LysM peptidoglycan-binding domain-containing M23 family metallopeptidase [Streptomyces sp. NPDC048278]|uniref:M23 family metallopeptidase n=1 Tax=Streptomyces sp. NPDC048278 TaxID=3155809 RepID=UPI003412C8B8
MPAKGKHRRPKSQRFTRSMAVAGTGGAALALPLMGTTGAHAATPQSLSEKTTQSLPVIEKTAVKQAPAGNSGATHSAHRVYTVVSGDYLSKIARDQHVRGGWHRLYADNREAVGGNPSLIHPGLELVLGGRHAATTDSGSRSRVHADPQPSRSTASSSSASSNDSNRTTGSNDSAGSNDSTGSEGSVATASGFALPVTGGAIGTGYHVAGSMWSSGYHTGVDFVVPTGTPVKAVGAGTVVTAGWGGAYGNQVVIRLADGYYAQYGHLSALSVSVGQTVTAGQQIGLSGATGNVTGPHLHFEIRTTPDYGSDVDPVAYLRAKGLTVG